MSMDKNIENTVQLHSWLVSFLKMSLFRRCFFRIFCKSTAWFLHSWNVWFETGEKLKFFLEILHFLE